MADQSPHWSAGGPTAGHYELDLTRTCLHQGRVLVTHKLMQALPAGELTLQDAQSDQPVTLTFIPPRTLTGLGPYFERHNLRPNDRLILVLDPAGGGIIDMRRRPLATRASRPETTVEPAAPERPQAIERIAAYGGSLEVRTVPNQNADPPQDDPIGRVRVARRSPAATQGAAAFPPAPQRDEKPAQGRSPGMPAPAQPESAPAPAPRAPAAQDPGPQRPGPKNVVPQARATQAPRQPAQDVTTAVRMRLTEPGVPAIIRATTLAEQLACDPNLVEDALDALSRDPDTGLDKINTGIYRHAVLTRSK